MKTTSFTSFVSALTLAFLPPAIFADGDDIINAPIAHAWKLFQDVNTAIPNDPQGRMKWEGWALGREVFANPNVAPTWPQQPPSPSPASFESDLIQQMMRRGEGKDGAAPKFDPAAGTRNETRLNKAVFDFIVGNDLYYVEGIEAYAKQGKKFEFTPDAIEIKAQWRKITSAQASRYHVAKVTAAGGTVQLWGLTSMHITTKELPNWFWATFEHKDNPGRELVIPDVKPQDQPAALQGTVWENYVLRGTQTDFTDSIGRPLLLASSQIEDGFQDSSSCITCHALATVNPAQTGRPQIDFLEFFDSSGKGYTGAPDTKRFLAPGDPTKQRYQQLDFVWSFFRASRRNP